MIRLAPCAVLVPLLLGGLANAQQTITVRTLALREAEMPELFLRGAKDYQALGFSAVQPGQMLRALAANPLPIYRRQADAQGNESWVVAHRVKTPARARGILLLALADGEEIQFTAIADDFAAARYNDWLLINASSKPIAFAVGEKAKPILIASGTSTTHRVSAPRGQGAAVRAQAPINDKPTIFYSTFWPVYEDRRNVVLFADDGPKILVKRIADMLARPKPPTAAD